MSEFAILKAAQDKMKTMKADRDERKRLDRIAAAEAARLRAIRQRAADESEAAVHALIADHNAQHGQYARVILASDLPTEKKCGSWTVLSDCEDRNCFKHYEEKKARNEATTDVEPEAEDFTALFLSALLRDKS